MRARLALFAILTSVPAVSPAPAGETVRITIDKLKFDPAQVSVHLGDTIEWANKDFVAHTATARNKDFDVAIPAKGVGRVTLQHAGEVEYFCRFHPNMTGRISVGPS